MNFFNSTNITLLLLINLLALLSSGSIGKQRTAAKEPPAEVRRNLFQQLLADRPDLRECASQQEGGIAAVQAAFDVEEVDLDGDGQPEYHLHLGGFCGCGAQNCSESVYRKAGQKFEGIFEGYGLTLSVLKTKTNGYLDLKIDAHDSAATELRSYYKFDGRQYRESSTDLVNLKTRETKPAYRRVRFSVGASSATLQGSASLIFPDTYLVGARAGQTMTIQVTAARRALTASVMSPSGNDLVADNIRTWTGVLKESGDYSISVSADARATPYTIIITIR